MGEIEGSKIHQGNQRGPHENTRLKEVGAPREDQLA